MYVCKYNIGAPWIIFLFICFSVWVIHVSFLSLIYFAEKQTLQKAYCPSSWLGFPDSCSRAYSSHCLLMCSVRARLVQRSLLLLQCAMCTLPPCSYLLVWQIRSHPWVAMSLLLVEDWASVLFTTWGFTLNHSVGRAGRSCLRGNLQNFFPYQAKNY